MAEHRSPKPGVAGSSPAAPDRAESGLESIRTDARLTSSYSSSPSSDPAVSRRCPSPLSAAAQVGPCGCDSCRPYPTPGGCHRRVEAAAHLVSDAQEGRTGRQPTEAAASLCAFAPAEPSDAQTKGLSEHGCVCSAAAASAAAPAFPSRRRWRYVRGGGGDRGNGACSPRHDARSSRVAAGPAAGDETLFPATGSEAAAARR